jgi:hypothetical protein
VKNVLNLLHAATLFASTFFVTQAATAQSAVADGYTNDIQRTLDSRTVQMEQRYSQSVAETGQHLRQEIAQGLPSKPFVLPPPPPPFRPPTAGIPAASPAPTVAPTTPVEDTQDTSQSVAVKPAAQPSSEQAAPNIFLPPSSNSQPSTAPNPYR